MTKPNWKPSGWRVLIDPDYANVTDWGFKIVESDRQGIAAVTKGKVVAMGADCYKGSRFSSPWCQVGDIVIYAKYGGSIIEDPDTKRKYVVVNDEDVIGVEDVRPS